MIFESFSDIFIDFINVDNLFDLNINMSSIIMLCIFDDLCPVFLFSVFLR